MSTRTYKTAAASALLGLAAATHASPTFTDPEVVGMANYVAAGGDRIAILANERSMDTDLNGDGVLNDSVLMHRSAANGALVNTGIAAWSFRIETDGDTIVFLQHENYVQQDLSGDGDRLDVVLAHYDIDSGQVTYTDIVPHYHTGSFGNLRSYSVDGNLIVYVVREFRVGADLNGDGDVNDYAVRYYDMVTGLVHDTGIPANYAVISDGRIAATVPEPAMQADLDGDGDADDNVVVVYDTATGVATPIFAMPAHNLTNPSSFPAIDGDRLIYRVHENWLGADVDGDGSLSTQNLIIGHDLATGQSQYLGFTGSKQLWLDGDFVAYYTSEHDVGVDVNGDGDTTWDWLTAWRHVPSGATRYVPEAGEYGIGAGIFVARQSENHFGTDANGDGDTSDMLAYVLAAAFPQPVPHGLPAPDAGGDPGDDGDGTGPELTGEAIMAQLYAAIAHPDVADAARDSVVARLDELMAIGMNPDLSDAEKVALAEPLVVELVADIDGFIASVAIAAEPAAQLQSAIDLLIAFLQQSGG